MAANIGEMFYTGAMPWHREGRKLAAPATVEEALDAGGLNWQVGDVALQTAEQPASQAPMRKAVVRLDRPAGEKDRVVGIVHWKYQPLQNSEGAMLFDTIFGQGRAVYETGGYLGNGNVVWLLARLNRSFDVGRGDTVEPYALYCNSHDGSRAFSMSLATIRVVCQNTLAEALSSARRDTHFRRGHSGRLSDHAAAAREFFGDTLKRLDHVANSYRELAKRVCGEGEFNTILEQLFPDPSRPANIAQYKGLVAAYELRLAQARQARQQIKELREGGIGSELESAKGSFWGALNSVTEHIDHDEKKGRLQHSLLGDGMALKSRAFRIMLDAAQGRAGAAERLPLMQAS